MLTTQMLDLVAPLSGVAMPLDQVPDQAFSTRLVGDGVCIDPASSTLRAPLIGTVSRIQESGHAISVTSDSGVQVLMHIGLDTVNLGGKGFTALVEEGQRVDVGQPLIEFDANYIAQHARSLLTMMLIVSAEAVEVLTPGSVWVEAGQPVLRLTGDAGLPGAPAPPETGPTLFSIPVILPNPNGLHARPAAVLTHAAKAFSATITLHKGQLSANAKSLVAIMGVQTSRGDELQLSAQGEDAAAALEMLTQLIASGCGEVDTPKENPLPVKSSVVRQVSTAQQAAKTSQLRGVCASPGSAVGRVFQFTEQPLSISEAGTGEVAERERLGLALKHASQALQTLQGSMVDSPQAAIFLAHQQMLEDPTLIERAQALIADGKSAAFAWNATIQKTAAAFIGSGSRLLAERASDLNDVGLRVLRLILGVREQGFEWAQEVILIADQLTPSQTAGLDTSKVLGFATVGGGATSHVAILARAFGLPALCGLPANVLSVADGTRVLLDADQGHLHLDPPLADIESVQMRREQQHQRCLREKAQAAEDALTLDGHRIEVSANVSSLEDTIQAMTLSSEGVGLLRSEFLYLDRATAPNDAEQVATYQAIANAVGPLHKLVVRTLDAGGDKPLAYMPMDAEENPFLGVRGIRLCLERPELLHSQLRAILSCAGQTQLHIMLPMVTQLSELRQARAILDEQARQMGLKTLPKIGIMIEVPAAALMADLFAPQVDFFSIGTNDLTQYTLAMDRGHPRLASQADALHPAVLRLISSTVKAAHAHGKWVGVCGALASETLAVPLLLGMGIDELSVSVPLIPAIKATVRGHRLDDCQAIVEHVLTLESAIQVRDALQAHEQTALEREC